MDILKKFRVEKDQADENLNLNQKLAVSALAIFGILIIVFWGIGMRNNIYRPFNNKAISKIVENQLSEEERLRSQDTDNDGLSDWEELYIYGTSPYLEDSDSDGINDGVEVKNKQNPNCPLGQDCGQVSNISEEDDSAGSSLIQDFENIDFSGEVFLNEDQAMQSGEDITKALSGQADPETLRKLLLDTGFDKELLDQMTDDQLMASYNSTLQANTGN